MKSHFVLAATAALFLSACSGGLTESSKVKTVINEGLKKGRVPCERAAIGTVGRSPSLSNFEVPKLLLAKGYVQEATVDVLDLIGSQNKKTPGYVLTESGKQLVAIPETTYDYPCIRKGVWQVQSIEAIDNGTDASGKTVANVRAKIRFEPEEWLTATRDGSHPGWDKVWDSIRASESKQWMYQLIRSGNDFFYTGPGTAVN